jgi:Holliday junction resolvase RusA-like endonuclease
MRKEQGMSSENDLGKVICEISMKMPSLNEYIRVCRTNPYMASKFKKDLESQIGIYVAGLPRMSHPVKIHFHWVEENKRRDLDNVCASKKFILDALVRFGVLTDDNRKYVAGFTDTFEYGKQAKVIMTIEEV